MVPAAIVIPATIACIKVAVVKKLVVEFWLGIWVCSYDYAPYISGHPLVEPQWY